MKNKNYQIIMTVLLMVFMATAVALTNGCKKSEPASSEDHSGHDHAMTEVADSKTAVAKTVEQTTCPVMGGKINKDVFAEYKGKKVYFCCSGCDTKFNADPEKYITKLPQFQK